MKSGSPCGLSQAGSADKNTTDNFPAGRQSMMEWYTGSALMADSSYYIFPLRV